MIKPHNTNSEFEFGGINHVALVCSDMAKTVDFYSECAGHAVDQVARSAGRHGAALLLRRRQRRLRGVLLVRRRARPGAGHLVARGDSRHRRHRQRGEHDEPPGVPRARGEVRRVPAATQGQGRARRAGAQPRREPAAGLARPCTPGSTCGRSTSSTPTASLSSSPAGPRNSPKRHDDHARRPRPTAGPRA